MNLNNLFFYIVIACGMFSLHVKADSLNETNHLISELTKSIKSISSVTENIQVNNNKGTFLGWVRLNESNKSRALLSARWEGDTKNSSYMVLSDGWWEHATTKGFYFVVDNKQLAFCHVNNFTLPTDKWVFVAVTWGQTENNNNCQIYIDGQFYTESNISIKTKKKINTINYFSDNQTDDPKNRIPSGLTSGFIYSPTKLDWKSIYTIYNSTKSAFYENRDGLLDKAIGGASYFSKFKERILFDEDIYWALSRKNTDEVLEQVAHGNFNVFVPCVWHGNGAYFKNSKKSYDPLVASRIEADDDPLRYLLAEANKKGIKVIPWFTVTLRETNYLPEFADAGLDGSFNVHNSLFRDFISSLIGEAVVNYKLESINVDYIRSMGVCLTDKCKSSFNTQYGKSLISEYYKSKISQASYDYIASWNRADVEDILKKIRFNSAAISSLKISVDAVPFNKELQFQGQDSISWLNNGLVDSVFSMNYQRNIEIEKMVDIKKKVNRGVVIPIISTFDKSSNVIVPRSQETMTDLIEKIYSNLGSDGLALYHRKTLTDKQISILQ